MNQELPILKRNCLPPKELLPEKSFSECARITLESRLLGNSISDFNAIGMLRESGSQIPYYSILTETTTKAWAC